MNFLIHDKYLISIKCLYVKRNPLVNIIEWVILRFIRIILITLLILKKMLLGLRNRMVDLILRIILVNVQLWGVLDVAMLYLLC